MENRLVKIIKKSDPSWWYDIGELYEIVEYQYKATLDGTIDYCFCNDCVETRGDKPLYEMYKVILPQENSGSIIPRQDCKVLR